MFYSRMFRLILISTSSILGITTLSWAGGQENPTHPPAHTTHSATTTHNTIQHDNKAFQFSQVNHNQTQDPKDLHSRALTHGGERLLDHLRTGTQPYIDLLEHEHELDLRAPIHGDSLEYAELYERVMKHIEEQKAQQTHSSGSSTKRRAPDDDDKDNSQNGKRLRNHDGIPHELDFTNKQFAQMAELSGPDNNPNTNELVTLSPSSEGVLKALFETKK